ncbi:hypothetical protein GIB67_018656 [Kingdonia uniflora]|uniref:Clp R domain-containing protein n=1 Tax=Kingdonia uniflora TaxID=39325 RepID=A0A7J7M2R0_9MAGN|nr:hypothetical protein GIB67_018656 [Kingdonia uniflora]
MTRAGLSTILQTLTPDASNVLNQSIAEASRRSHGQTTPLHVAATLLESPSGFLSQACIRSHPNSSHPLQCRALELCFSVALERLPAAPSVSGEPQLSNALVAALKRAQAHQRRGCPEQQQQPLLAVKVELEQLIVSILDDPSVSRVMREASFSSPAVKATIEQSLNHNPSVSVSNLSTNCLTSSSIGFRPNRNLYLNPKLQQGNSDQPRQVRRDEVKRVMDILLRSKKRNPVLVGDSEPEFVVKELLEKIEKKEVAEGLLRNVQVVQFSSDRTEIPAKLKELGDLIDRRTGGILVNLGDLKWLVEQSPAGSGSLISETGKVAVAEMGKLLTRFREGNNKVRLWFVGTATCETYMRCQVHHPSMENDWDLQAVPIAAKSPLPGLFPRMGGNGILSSSVGSLTPLKGYQSPFPRRTAEKCCPLCTQSYEEELAKTVAKEYENTSTDEKLEVANRQPLPQWLQIAKPDQSHQTPIKDQELIRKQKSEELLKKWNYTCARLHPGFHQNLNSGSERLVPSILSTMPHYSSLGRPMVQPKLQNRILGGALQMNQSSVLNPRSECLVSPPRSPVGLDLVLGRSKFGRNSPERPQREPNMEFTQTEKVSTTLDPDSFKSLFKGLTEKVWWQKDAAAAISATVVHCRSGNSRRQGFGCKSDTWMLFAGPDRVGKKKMATAVSELVNRATPITIRLGSRCYYDHDDDESDVNFRGKTTLDKIAITVERNPSSVIVLEDIDRADMLVSGSIKRAIERGRLPDSHGREVSLKNVIFILTTNWVPETIKDSPNWLPNREERLASVANKGWQLQLSVGPKNVKRRPDWLDEDNRPTKAARTDGGAGSGPGSPAVSFDLNQMAEAEGETAEGSRNSSDLTVEHDHEPTTVSRELLSCIDEVIFFNPVDFGSLKSKVATTIATQFSTIVGDGQVIDVDKEALDQIVGGIWFGRTELEAWTENVLAPSFIKVKDSLPVQPSTADVNNTTIVKLVSVRDSERRSNGDRLPSKITVVVADGHQRSGV